MLIILQADWKIRIDLENSELVNHEMKTRSIQEDVGFGYMVEGDREGSRTYAHQDCALPGLRGLHAMDPGVPPGEALYQQGHARCCAQPEASCPKETLPGYGLGRCNALSR